MKPVKRISWMSIHKGTGLGVLCFLFGFLLGLAEMNAAISAPACRFGSLKSGEVNVRTGPGSHYPIAWVLVRKGLPVKVLAEFENWRKIEDVEGKQGWVHQSLLAQKQTVVVLEAELLLRKEPCLDAVASARLEKGVVASLLEVRGAWCHIGVEKLVRGWVSCAALWGGVPGSSLPEK